MPPLPMRPPTMLRRTMLNRRGQIRTLSLALLIAALSSLGNTAPSTNAAPVSTSNVTVTGPVAYHLGAEVRLRKIHLVRPDLISYPLCYEIYC